MKLLIELPTWLGDAIMATPAIENLLKYYKPREIVIVGSFVSTQLFVYDKRIKSIVVDNTKKNKFRFLNIFKFAKDLGDFDLAISFRSSLWSKVLFYFTKSEKRFYFQKPRESMHQVLKYNNFINNIISEHNKAGDLMLNFKPFKYNQPTLGINPGATYGSAKRWYPNEFAKVAVKLASKYDIVIFGGPNEIEMATDIENSIRDAGITNVTNLAGKTTIPELIEKIAELDVFITNDSGPMHIAAVYKVRTYAIFGPTNFNETNQWNNPFENIITKNLDCSPCMKRKCPLKHHNCMKEIKAEDVLSLIT